MDDDRSCMFLVVIGFFLITLLVGGFMVLSNSTYDSSMRVKALEWRRRLNIEVFKVLGGDSLQYHQPSDAYNLRPYLRSFYVNKTCYRRTRVKGGDMRTESYNCGYWDSERRVKYNINRWVYDHDLVTSGSPQNERVWPAFTPSPIEEIGAERESERHEEFFVHFVRLDNDQGIDLPVPTYEGLIAYRAETSFTIKFNRLEQPQWDTLRRIDAR